MEDIQRNIQLGVSVHLVKNLYPRGTPKLYRLQKTEDPLGKLLSDSEKLLELTNHAKKLFDENGTQITSVDDIEQGKTYFVSAGESFGKPHMEKIQKSPISKRLDPDLNRTPIVKESPRPIPKVQKHLPEAKMTDVDIQKLIADSNFSVEESYLYAQLAVYSTLSLKQKQSLSNYEELKEKMLQFQIHTFSEQLLHQSIMCKKSKSLSEFTADTINELKAEEMRFSITGEKSSGKTTLLYHIAMNIYRKLLISGQKFLPIPINFLFNETFIEDPTKFYEIVYTLFIQSLRYNAPQFIPYCKLLGQWLSTLPTSQVYPKPNNFQGIDHKLLSDAGKELFENIDYSATFKFIHEASKAFGFSGVFLVIDNYDVSTDAIRQAIESNMDDDLLAVASSSTPLRAKNVVQLFTESSAEIEEDPRVLSMASPSLTLTAADAQGCPGYLNAFSRICDLAQTIAGNSQLSTIQKSGTVSKSILLQKEILRFAQFVKNAGNKKITADILNELETHPPRDIRVEGVKEEKQAESDSELASDDEINDEISGIVPQHAHTVNRIPSRGGFQSSSSDDEEGIYKSKL